MSFSEYLQYIKANGIPRTDAEGGEVALKKTEALKALDILRDNSVGILGGDVYEREDDDYFRPTYDNWYCDKDEGEADEAFSFRSFEKAQKYISGYCNTNIKEPFFVFVIE